MCLLGTVIRTNSDHIQTFIQSYTNRRLVQRTPALTKSHPDHPQTQPKPNPDPTVTRCRPCPNRIHTPFKLHAGPDKHLLDNHTQRTSARHSHTPAPAHMTHTARTCTHTLPHTLHTIHTRCTQYAHTPHTTHEIRTTRTLHTLQNTAHTTHTT